MAELCGAARGFFLFVLVFLAGCGADSGRGDSPRNDVAVVGANSIDGTNSGLTPTARLGGANVPANAATSVWWPEALLGLYCVLIVLASLVGGWLPTLMHLSHTRMQLMLSLVGGLMLGIGLFHMLPHAVAELGSLDRAIWWLMVGLVTMFFLIRMFHFHQHDPVELPQATREVIRSQAEGVESQSKLVPALALDSGPSTLDSHHDHHHCGSHKLGWIGIALGLSLHTLIDGIALAASVQADAGHQGGWALLGVGTFLAVVLHKPLDAVSITSLMISGGWSPVWRSAVNAGFAMMCPLGAFLFVAGIERFSGYQQVIVGCSLAFAAGVFLCISLGDLLPEMEFHSHNRLPLSAALIAGIMAAWLIRYIEPPHLHQHPPAYTSEEDSTEDQGEKSGTGN